MNLNVLRISCFYFQTMCKKLKRTPSRCSLRYGKGLFRLSLMTESGEADSARGASVGTGAALGALVGVDGIDIAFRDSANGTFVDAGAASNAVFANYVSHSLGVEVLGFRNKCFE